MGDVDRTNISALGLPLPGAENLKQSLAGPLASALPADTTTQIDLRNHTTLVTGCLGAVGGELSQKLLEPGAALVGVDILNEETRSQQAKRRRLEHLKRVAGQNGARFDFYRVDIRDPALQRIMRDHRPSVVLHTAAMVQDRTSVEKPIEFLKVNVIGTACVLRASQAAGSVKSFVLTGSRSAMGEAPGAQCETDPCRPVNPYGASKLAQEAVCHAWHHNHGLPVTVIRMNPQICIRTDMMPRRLLTALHFSQPIEKFGSGSAVRDWMHIQDTVDALLAAAAHPMNYQVYVVGTGRATTLDELIDAAACVVGRRPEVVNRPTPPGDAIYGGVGRFEKIRNALGWQPKRTLEQGIKDLYSHLKYCNFEC